MFPSEFREVFVFSATKQEKFTLDVQEKIKQTKSIVSMTLDIHLIQWYRALNITRSYVCPGLFSLLNLFSCNSCTSFRFPVNMGFSQNLFLIITASVILVDVTTACSNGQCKVRVFSFTCTSSRLTILSSDCFFFCLLIHLCKIQYLDTRWMFIEPRLWSWTLLFLLSSRIFRF